MRINSQGLKLQHHEIALVISSKPGGEALHLTWMDLLLDYYQDRNLNIGSEVNG